MCGIAGILRFDGSAPDQDRLDAMRAHLQHRGPEGHGVGSFGPCGMTATRLSVIDVLSGDQPMSLPADHASAHDGKYATLGALHLVFNGEIYNHRELRAKLEKRGHRFRSDHADTEVLLFGYRQWGDRLPRHIQGMFAFAIYDEDKRCLFLCRDRAGAKPLFYRKGGDAIVFASLAGAVLRGGEPGARPGVNHAALRTFLRYGFTFGQSLHDGIQSLPPAHWIRVEATGKVKSASYWRPPPISLTSTAMGAVDSLKEVLTEAIVARLEADVPYGCFLSGALNSSVIAALAQQHLKQQGQPALHTFSVSLPDLDYDESRHAQAVAQHIGAQHTAIRATPGRTIEDIRTLVQMSGDPFADPAMLTTYWLCRSAREHIRVALTGIGGDEIFGGHKRYLRLRRYQRHGWWLRLNPAGPEAGREPAHQYQALIRLFDEHQIADLLGEPRPESPAHAAEDWPGGDDHVHSAMRWDLRHALPQDVLRRADHASMAVALELRYPMLATGVMDLAGHLPGSVLMPGGRDSGLLRQVAATLLPQSVASRPRGAISLPLDQWFRGVLREELESHLKHGRLSELGIAPAPVTVLMDQHLAGTHDHTEALLGLLCLAIWADVSTKA